MALKSPRVEALHARTVARKFSIGGLCISEGGFGFVREGLDTQKLTKTQLIYSVSCYNLGGLEIRMGGLSPQIPPVATGLLHAVTIVLLT